MPGGKISPALILYQTALTMVDWVFPPECGGCSTGGIRWCNKCDEEINYISNPLCEVCGLPSTSPGICNRCLSHPMAFDAARSVGLYSGSLRNAVLKIKYKRDYGLGETLSGKMLNLIERLDWGVDAVVPVPIGRIRKRERGYNQAVLLARPISLGLGVPLQEKLVTRLRDTISQVGLSEAERYTNVSGAFRAVEGLTQRKNILLVDDVMTTGATLDSCTNALIKAGANKVYCLTLARALDTRML